MIEEFEEKALRPVKMPFGINAFFGYSILLMVGDIISCTNLPLGRLIVQNIGWSGSGCYLPPWVWFVTLMISRRFLKEAGPQKGDLSMRYFILALMVLEILKYIAYVAIFKNVGDLRYNPYTAIGPLRVVFSVVIPLVWILVWFNGASARYLRRL